MKRIDSTQNQKIKHLVNLQDKSYRHNYQQFIAQGYTTCSTLFEQKYDLLDLYVTDQGAKKHTDFLQNKDYTVVSEQIMHKICTTKTPSNIIAVFSIPKPMYTLTHNALVLHTIQDPGNLGTLIRTAAAMNVANIFIIDGVDPYSPKVIQATAGTIAFVNIIITNWQNFLSEHIGIETCALVVDQGASPDETNISKSILVIGNEGQGLPQETINNCTHKITIPMPGKTESLNAAVAGSIALYIRFYQSKKE